MTKSEIEGLSFEDAARYFENDYPFILPENEVMDILEESMMATLTPLEKAYVQWMVETNNTDIAISKFIHPAVYFDVTRFGKNYLKNKVYLTELIRRIRRECPYLRLYSSDYLAGLLHSEIQYLRSRERKDRFYGPNVRPEAWVGKKSPHDQEMEEIDRLLACLKQLHELKLAVGGFNNGSSDAESRNLDSGIDRIIARSKDLIHKRETSTS